MVSESISDVEFSRIQKVMFEKVGVTIGPAKRALVVGRLSRRLRHHNLKTFAEYLRLVDSEGDEGEWQIMADLLTTHETYFFREPKHFDFLKHLAKTSGSRRDSFRVWSAACSTGEEAYSAAMILADTLQNRDWEIVASDISRRTVEESQQGLYSGARVAKVSRQLLAKHFLKGVRSQAGKYMVSRELRQNMDFRQLNLNEPVPSEVGYFDVIFLRNVLIYFNLEQKRKIVNRLITRLKHNGYLLIGHSETLNSVTDKLTSVAPSIYQRTRVASAQSDLAIAEG